MKKKILLVDDNPDLRYSVIEGIGSVSDDYEFVEAESGSEAFAKLKYVKVDAILLDVMMPDLDGWEVATQIKNDDSLKDIPIIFLTAKTDEFSRRMGRLKGDEFMEKPFQVMELKGCLDKFTGVA